MGNFFYSGFRRRPRRYLAQVSLATAALFFVLWVEQLIAGAEIARAVLVGAIASTAFILFISPHRPTAMPRRVLGGHGWAIVIALVLSFLTGWLCGEDWLSRLPMLFSIVAAVTVGAAMLAMAATNTEHPPAAGTALAIAGVGYDWQLISFVIISILILSVVHRLIRNRLIDLY